MDSIPSISFARTYRLQRHGMERLSIQHSASGALRPDGRKMPELYGVRKCRDATQEIRNDDARRSCGTACDPNWPIRATWQDQQVTANDEHHRTSHGYSRMLLAGIHKNMWIPPGIAKRSCIRKTDILDRLSRNDAITVESHFSRRLMVELQTALGDRSQPAVGMLG